MNDEKGEGRAEVVCVFKCDRECVGGEKPLHLSPEHSMEVSGQYCITPRAGLCPWDNRGKANSWRTPPPPVHKNLEKNAKLRLDV
jgi:hypothetical protein